MTRQSTSLRIPLPPPLVHGDILFVPGEGVGLQSLTPEEIAAVGCALFELISKHETEATQSVWSGIGKVEGIERWSR